MTKKKESASQKKTTTRQPVAPPTPPADTPPPAGESFTFTCCVCNKTMVSSKNRLPMGWKRLAGPTCSSCMGDDYVGRVVSLPVVRVMGHEWQEMRPFFNETFSKSSRLLNWATMKLLAAEPILSPGTTKLPKAPEVSLYKEFHGYPLRSEWDGATSSASTILNAHHAKWKKMRFDVLISQKKSPPFCKKRAPFTISSQSFNLEVTTDGQLLFHGNVNGRNLTLVLGSSRDMWRQIENFKKIANGTAIKGQAILVEQKAKSVGHNQPGIVHRPPGGMNRFRTHVMLKIFCQLPKPPVSEDRPNVLTVVTDPNAMFVCSINTNHSWNVNGDDIRQSTFAHHNFLRKTQEVNDTVKQQSAEMAVVVSKYQAWRQRFSEDMKHSRRTSRERRKLNQATENRAIKYRNRTKTWCLQRIADLIRHAKAAKVGVIIYDDTCRSFLPSFCWADFKQWLTDKCEFERIELRKIADEPDLDDDTAVDSCLDEDTNKEKVHG